MDVFVSYSSKDTERTKQICDILRSNGISSWVAYENELYGENYATTIVNEIGAAKVFLVLVSEESNKSKHVINEINCASMHDKVILPVFLEDVKLSPAFEYYIAGNHWLNYSDTADFVQQFVGRICSLVGKPAAEEHISLEVLPDEEDDIINPLPGKPAKPVEAVAPENPADLPEDMVVEPDEAVAEDSADSEADTDGLKTLDSDALDSEEESDDIKDNTVKEKKKGKLLKVILSLLLAVIAVVVLVVKVIIPAVNYNKAAKFAENGDNVNAAICYGKAGDYKDAREKSFALWGDITERETISAGGYHTVGLKSDGTVVAVGSNFYGQCDVSDWTDIVAVTTGKYHTVGLKSDGTVVSIGHDGGNRRKISGWTDVVAIAASEDNTYGLKSDGTVILSSHKYVGGYVLDEEVWTDIVAISAYSSLFGLKSDGTVVTTSSSYDLSGWTDIVAVSEGAVHTVGLKSDGTVVAVGHNVNYYNYNYAQCDVSDWTDIVAVSAGAWHTVGLKSDGTVVAVGDNYDGQCDISDWTDIVAVSAGAYHTVGLKSDGTVVAVGDNDDGQCDISDWKNIAVKVNYNIRYEATENENYADAEAALASGNEAQAAILFGKVANEGYADARERSFALWDEIAVRETIAAGQDHTVGLKSDGTVVAVGWNEYGQCDVSSWKDIAAVTAGWYHTVGLKADGTVVAVGNNDCGRCNVSGWKDIVAISAGKYHTVGLKSDGTVVAVGWNNRGQCNVGGWKDIIAISAGDDHTIALKSDGTVVAVGENDGGACDVGGWEDIVAVSASWGFTVGLKSDGTVVAVGNNLWDQCEVSGWKDIVAISTGGNHTVGLKSNGTVVMATYRMIVGDPSWRDIVAVAAGYDYTIGLKSDGTVVAVGENDDGQCNVGGWKNIKQP